MGTTWSANEPTHGKLIGLIGNESTCFRRGILGAFRPRPLKIDTLVDEDMEWQSCYQIRKGSIKGQKMRKLNDTEKFT